MNPRPLGEYSELQRDILAVVAAIGNPNGQRIWSAVEKAEQTRRSDTTIYENLDELADRGLVEKVDVGPRENAYDLTDDGRDLLEREVDWLLEL